MKARKQNFTKSSDLLVIASDKIFCFNAESYKFVKYVANKHLKTPHCLTIAPNGCMAVCDEGDLTAREGDSHMKQTGMLVVSLRGVNFGFWSRLGCSGQSTNVLSRQGLVFREETQNYAKRNRSQIFFLTLFVMSLYH